MQDEKDNSPYSEVHAQVENKVREIHSIIGVLREKLSPVMARERIEEDTCERTIQESSPVVAQQRMLLNELVDIESQISTILSRIEV